MAMKMLNDEDLNNVSGGSIVFTTDCTMCGFNCNNQFMVNDFDSVLSYISENKYTMDERDMLKALMEQGLLTRI